MGLEIKTEKRIQRDNQKQNSAKCEQQRPAQHFGSFSPATHTFTPFSVSLLLSRRLLFAKQLLTLYSILQKNGQEDEKINNIVIINDKNFIFG
jgi:hypothetical protein